MKRLISLAFAMLILISFMPFPVADALEAIAPEVIAIGEVGGSAALPAAGILALYEVLLGGLKAAGLEFMDINGVSALVPNENLGKVYYKYGSEIHAYRRIQRNSGKR
ncbi:hypothetical protein FACS1894202_14220 [Clostridia bacterium]|nr:hypothetical protein FACS1894202_14220 [Clostridia bacterium]